MGRPGSALQPCLTLHCPESCVNCFSSHSVIDPHLQWREQAEGGGGGGAGGGVSGRGGRDMLLLCSSSTRPKSIHRNNTQTLSLRHWGAQQGFGAPALCRAPGQATGLGRLRCSCNLFPHFAICQWLCAPNHRPRSRCGFPTKQTHTHTLKAGW